MHRLPFSSGHQSASVLVCGGRRQEPAKASVVSTHSRIGRKTLGMGPDARPNNTKRDLNAFVVNMSPDPWYYTPDTSSRQDPVLVFQYRANEALLLPAG